MSNILEFSKEVQAKLRHYVYRLVDPRNGQTFYVGEGCGNRVFAHVNATGEDYYKSINASNEDIMNDSAKIQKIIEIKNSGLPVIHIIQRWGMNQDTAFEVESAFIDYFGLPVLTNKVKGHHAERGMKWTDELEKILYAPIFDDYPSNNCPKFILIKIKDYWLEKNGNDIYETARGNWRLNKNKANKYPYVLAVKYGIVVGVFKIHDNGWEEAGGNRIRFTGEKAPEEVSVRFLGKKIPEKYRKRQNPAGYCD